MKIPDVNSDNIVFNIPEKRKNKYYSKIEYNNEPFVLELENIKNIETDENFITIENVPFFEVIENHSKTKCFEKSKEWFKGKSFSFEFIQNAFKSCKYNDKIRLEISRDLLTYSSEGKLIPFSENIRDVNLTISVSELWISPHHIGLRSIVNKIKCNELFFIEESDEDYPSEIESELNE
jgi:hypothetical protein